jgi:hypothetical protein
MPEPLERVLRIAYDASGMSAAVQGAGFDSATFVSLNQQGVGFEPTIRVDPDRALLAVKAAGRLDTW